MKKILLLILLSTLLLGCRYSGLHGVAGSGVRKTETRQVAAFNSITADGAFEIEVVQQQTQSLTVEGDDNVLPLVTTSVVNGRLRISNERNYSVSKAIKIKISTPNLEALSANGASTIDVNGVNSNKFEIESNGAGTIRVSGTTESLRINANGAGTVDAQKLRALKAEVESNGVSEVEVFAKDELNVTVSGPSTVTYDGNPSVNQTINGPGSVKKKESSGA